FPQQFARAAETAGPEARRRLQQMIRQAETLPATVALRRLAARLAESPTPQSRDVLNVLAEGKQPNRISMHANKVMEERKKMDDLLEHAKRQRNSPPSR